MKTFFTSMDTLNDWRNLVVNPNKQWKKGKSACELATLWWKADGFPKKVKIILENSGIKPFQELVFLIAFPEYKVQIVPQGRQGSQNDLFVLAKGLEGLIVIMVEGKESEDFGELINNLKKPNQKRIDFLLETLNLKQEHVFQAKIRYQLLHRTASALIEAERFNSKTALMLVDSFSPTYKHFEDYAKFLKLFKIEAGKDSVSGPVRVNGIDLYFAWVAEAKNKEGEASILTP